jgi:hypothetical protein
VDFIRRFVFDGALKPGATPSGRDRRPEALELGEVVGQFRDVLVGAGWLRFLAGARAGAYQDREDAAQRYDNRGNSQLVQTRSAP